MSKLTITKVEKALREHSGVLVKAAEACGVHRHTLTRFMDKHPELQEVREQVDEELMDIAEHFIARDVKGGDMKTIRWYAERKGKNRGYVTRVEETGKDGAPIEFGTVRREVVDPKEDE